MTDPIPEDQLRAWAAGTDQPRKRLAEEVLRLRGALEPFAFIEWDSTQEAWSYIYRDQFKEWIDFGDIETARRALGENP